MVEFKRWIERRHELAKEWKARTGRPVVGYFCCVTPEEMIYAADMLPVRVSGSYDRFQVVDQHVPMYACGLVRSCIDLAARGVYDYLDAVVIPNTCDMVFRAEYWWRAVSPKPKPVLGGIELAPHVWYLKYPEKIKGRGTFDYFLEELRYFKQYLERLSGVELTDERLSHAISVYNEHYDLMRALREARKQNPPPVSGHDAWQIEFASLLMPKDEHNKYLRVYLDRLPQRQGKPKEAVRLYLGPACAMDQVSAVLYDIIERCGGQVVSEDISWGTSYHWTKIATDVEPLQAIAAHRLDIHCPRSTVDDSIPEHRFEHIKQTIEGYDVRGAIFYNTPYCECRATENPHIRDRFRDEYNLPVLFLDGAYPPEGLQQLRNRIQAFIEMVSG